MKHTTWLYKTTAVVNTFSMVLQLLFPVLFGLAAPVQAEGSPAALLTYNADKNIFKLTVSTQREVHYSLWYSRADGPTEAITGSETQSPQFEKELYAGTCSNGTCTPHSVKKGLLHWSAGQMQGAIVFKVDSNSLSTISTYGIEKFDITPNEEKWLNETDASPPTSSLAAPTVATPKECLSENAVIKNSTVGAWKNDLETGVAGTIDNVQLGVKYVFPQNLNVSVTFTCLPKDETLRTPLKIQQVKTSELKLPADMTNVAEYAYDITTGMEDGSFTYDVTLPKVTDNTSISYIEKPIETAKNYQVGAVEVQRINDDNISQQNDSVKATGIDHFTIFIATYSDSSLEVEQTQYHRGEEVTVGASGLTSNGSTYYKIVVYDPSESLISSSSCQRNISSLSYRFTLSGSAQIGTGWKAELLRASSSSCASSTIVGTDYFEVTASTTPTTLTNPTLSNSCGLDIALVIDNSNSIDGTELNQMKTAMTGLVNALTGTPTQFSVTRFGTNASVLQSFTSDTSLVNAAINSITTNGGGTNWENALNKAASTFDPRANKPNLIIFASDGNPTFPNCGGSNTCASDVNAAIIEANHAKQITARILALGIGNELSTNNLKAISGLNVNTGDVLTSDVITTDFSGLATQLATFATQTCGGTITINKYIDSISPENLATNAWTFTTNVAGYTSVQTTNGQVNLPVPAGSGYSISEASPLIGYTFGSASCQKSTGATVGIASGSSITGITVGADDIISCNFVNLLSCHAGQHTLEGKIKSNGYTTGNLCSGGGSCWSEGENIPARLTITGLDVGVTNSVVIEHDYQDAGITGYENFNSATSGNGTATGVSLSAPTIVSCGSGTTCKQYTLSFIPAASTVQLDWNALLSDTAAQWSGASLHYRLITGACGGAGNKDIPINPKQITVLGSITPIKSTANGAMPSDWTFAITGNTSVSGIASGTTAINLALNANNGDALYTITESGPSGWELDSVSGDCTKASSNSATVTLTSTKPDVTCTFTNKRTVGTIVVDKVTDPTGSSQSFAFTTTGAGYAGFNLTDSATPNSQTLPTGTYSVAETSVDGWNSQSSCVSSLGNTETANSLQLHAGETITCTFTNTLQRAYVTLVKAVVNNDGGLAHITDWTLTATGAASLSGISGSSAVTHAQVTPGTYLLSESNGPTGYAASLYSCVVNSLRSVLGNSITLVHGDEAVCTITNDDIAPQLTVIKHVVNNNGGGKTAANFTMNVTGTNVSNSSFAGSESGTTVTLNAGSYSVDEAATSGYTKSIGANCSGTIAVGETKTCTITNDDQAPTLTLIKQVMNDNGGSASASAWTLSAAGPISISGITGAAAVTNAAVRAGTYALSESGPNGYDAGSWNCVGGTQLTNTITLTEGQSATCTITNDDQLAHLTLVKQVVLDNGGNDPATAWTLSATGPTPISGVTGNVTVTNAAVSAGTYTLAESGPSGYSAGNWSCVGGSQNGSQITIANGQSATCTIANDDITPTLTVIKDVINDQGGTATVSAFGITLDSTPVDFDNGVPVNSTTTRYTATPMVAANHLYTVAEAGAAGYAAGSWNCVDVQTGQSMGTSFSLQEGQNVKCTITNDDQFATLVVKKVVKNDNGGTLKTNDFSFIVNTWPSTQFEIDGQNDLSVWAGTYTVTEPTVTGYATTYDNCTNVTIPNGGTATCTITNDDVAPSLTLVKLVTNDGGGTASPSAWTLSATGPTSISGAGGVVSGANFKAGTYVLSESGVAGYTAGSWNCAGVANVGNSVTLGLGQSATCTITNDDIAPRLKLIKVVTNDNGGTATPSAWMLTAAGESGFSDTGDSVVFHTVKAGVEYTLSESAVPGYEAGTWSCNGGTWSGSNVTLGVDDEVTCTIINNDQTAHLTLVKQVVLDNGGNDPATAWTLSATGPTPISGVTGNVTVTNAAVSAGTYTLAESGPSGYSAGNWSCVGGSQNGSQITIANGQSATCTIANDDITPTLTVIKHVVNDNGGAATITDFGIKMNSDLLSFDSGSASGTIVTYTATPIVLANTSYILSENDLPGYTEGTWACIDVATGQSIVSNVLHEGQNVRCEITNNDLPGTLIVQKVVIGSSDSPARFSFSVNGGVLQSFEADGQSDVVVNAGTYSVTEPAVVGYETTYSNCSGLVIANGGSATCTITNSKQGSITIVKNTLGGNGTFDFTSETLNSFSIPTVGNTGRKVFNNLNSGVYAVTETALDGWTLSPALNCSDPDGGSSVDAKTRTVSLDLDPGESITCTYTNLKLPKLTVIKHVINDNGGTKIAANFTMKVTGSSMPSPSSFAGNETGTIIAFTIPNGGTYNVDEDSVVGYAKTIGANCSGTLTWGDDKTCTITNNDIAPTITLIKDVTNDNGGDAGANDFGLTIGGTSVTSGQVLTVNAHTDYALNEVGLSGYSFVSITGIGCPTILGGTVNLYEGQQLVCTITNDDVAPLLKLSKIVVNDDGGVATAGAWTLTATGEAGFSDFGDSITFHSVKAGVTYGLRESGPVGYTDNWWKCDGGQASGNTVLLSVGQQVTCTITNNDVAPTLTVIKTVVNDNGGIKTVADFPLAVNGSLVTSGVAETLVANYQYTVTETNLPGYAASVWGGDCAQDGTITLAPGDNKTCTITNDDIAPTLTLVKVVDNQQVGTAQPSAWTLQAAIAGDYSSTISGPGPTVGPHTVTAGRNYVLSEYGGPAEYTAATWLCDGGTVSNNFVGDTQVNLPLATNVTCSITNTRDTGTIKIVKNAIGGNGTFTFTSNFGVSSITTANGTGTQTISGLGTGTTYAISESDLSGWDLNTAICDHGTPQAIQVIKDTTTTCTFTNTQRSSVLVNKFEDVNGNGTKDSGESLLPGWEILFGQTAQITDATGSARFSVVPGDYLLSETMQDGWEQTGMYCNDQSGVSITSPGEAYGHHGNCGGWNGCGDAATCAQWACEEKGYSNVVSYGAEKPCTEFSSCNLFYSRGNVQMNWGNRCPVMGVTDIVCSNSSQNSSSGEFNSTTHTLTLNPGDNASCYIGNFKKGSVSVWKYNDVDGDGVQDEDEAYMSDWTIQLSKASGLTQTATTSATVATSFTGLSAGSYTLSEEIQAGWTQTNISCGQNEESRITNNSYPISVRSGSVITCKIGNQFVPPEMTIEKYNDRWPNAQAPGSNVHYTIVVTALHNLIHSPSVRDLLPKNITYRAGSFQAVSSIHGALTISEPTYHSPGTWALPDMVADEQITLTYTGDVSNDIKAGTYKDLAWASGTWTRGDGDTIHSVLASSVATDQSSDTGVITDTFVGTKILVDRSQQDSHSVDIIQERQGEVLGATTELPATGTNGVFAIIGVSLIILGSTLYLMDRKNRRQHV